MVHNKHYIRLNDENFVIKAFSTAFEQHEDGYICINEDGGRHYNPVLFDEHGRPCMKYENGEIVAVDLGEPDTSEADAHARLDEIDLASVRASRAVSLALSNGETPEQGDIDRLAELEAEADTIRATL